MKDLTHEQLTKILDYDSQTGIFTWKITDHKMQHGRRAGYLDKSNNAYRITIYKKRYKASHLAWFYVYKKFPEARLYFIDKDSTNIRISNLKEGKTTTKSFKKIKVICPDCKTPREVYPTGIKKVLLVGELPEIPCKLCARKRKRKENKKLIQVGNCFIKPSTKRCHKARLGSCPNYNICLDIAAKKCWPGWICVRVGDLSAKT